MGQSITVLTYTFDNVVNALDLDVGGILRQRNRRGGRHYFHDSRDPRKSYWTRTRSNNSLWDSIKPINTNRVAAELRPVLRRIDS